MKFILLFVVLFTTNLSAQWRELNQKEIKTVVSSLMSPTFRKMNKETINPILLSSAKKYEPISFFKDIPQIECNIVNFIEEKMKQPEFNNEHTVYQYVILDSTEFQNDLAAQIISEQIYGTIHTFKEINDHQVGIRHLKKDLKSYAFAYHEKYKKYVLAFCFTRGKTL